MGKRVSVITYQFSIVVKSLERGLKEQGFEVTLLQDKLNDILDVLEVTDVFILYLPETSFDDMERVKRIILICDNLKDRGRNLIFIGSDANREDFIKTAPMLKNNTWINRPVDMSLLIEEIEKEAVRLEKATAKKKILIIDDDPIYAKMVGEWLAADFDAEVVSDGMLGITYLTNHKVNLILLDYEMPVIDGPKILEMLRMHPDTASIPVIFLTGIGTKESITRVMGFKPQGYVLKSTTRNDLIGTLKNFFEKQTSR